MWSLCEILTDFRNSFTGWFSIKFAIQWLLKISPYLAYVATLPHITLCNISVRKQAVDYTLQGSVATYLRCDGVVNNQSKKS